MEKLLSRLQQKLVVSNVRAFTVAQPRELRFNLNDFSRYAKMEWAYFMARLRSLPVFGVVGRRGGADMRLIMYSAQTLRHGDN
jgi:hypothetical protein